jgi:hypothetical protein
MRCEVRSHGIAGLKTDKDRGMTDVAGSRLADFDLGSIIALGKKLSAEGAKSSSQKKQK